MDHLVGRGQACLPAAPAAMMAPIMWDEPYLETCCRSALHRLVLSGAVGRPPDLKDGPMPAAARRHGPGPHPDERAVRAHRPRAPRATPARWRAGRPEVAQFSGAVTTSPSSSAAIVTIRAPSAAEIIIRSPCASMSAASAKKSRDTTGLQPVAAGLVVPQGEPVGVGEHGQIANGEGHGDVPFCQRKSRRPDGQRLGKLRGRLLATGAPRPLMRRVLHGVAQGCQGKYFLMIT